MRYAADGYAVLGYFLQNETQVESAAIGVSTGSATAYATLNLQGDSLAASTSIGDVYSVLNIASIATATSTMLGDVNPSYHYAAAGYAEVGYFLLDEAPVLSSSFAISTGTGEVYSVLNDLQSNSRVVSTSFGDVYSTLDDLQSNSFATSIGSGAIYSTLALSGSGGGISTLDAAIMLDMAIAGNLTTNFSASGALKLDLTLSGDIEVVAKLTGDMYSTLLLVSSTIIRPDLQGKLTFPSIYTGTLSMKTLTDTQSMVTLTPIYTIKDVQ